MIYSSVHADIPAEVSSSILFFTSITATLPASPGQEKIVKKQNKTNYVIESLVILLNPRNNRHGGRRD